jgi:uncharacterized protein (DUF3084 family)
MSSGFVLILAVLILGGVIATLGDRLGTRVGKARLSLFNLRPRRTATIVTILTGIVVSASTLVTLFAVSDPLRTGVFELDMIQRKLRRSRAELNQTKDQKTQVERELNKVQKNLTETNQSLQTEIVERKAAITERKRAIAERARAQAEVANKQTELSRTQHQLMTVSQQILNLRQDINHLQAERNQVLHQRDQDIKAKDTVILEREVSLRKLEARQDSLINEVKDLERVLRQGNVAIQRGQVLASAAVRIVQPGASQQVVDQLLSEANRNAIQLVRPGNTGKIVQITNVEVERLINQIEDGQDYVIRIFSAANYLLGETQIQVVADAIRNQVVFLAGDVVAATSIDSATITDAQIQDRINLLIASANFRARSLGILTDSVQIGRIQNLVMFLEQVRQSKQTLVLKAVAMDVTYTSGPLTLEFVAEQNGKVLFRTKEQPPSSTGKP